MDSQEAISVVLDCCFEDRTPPPLRLFDEACATLHDMRVEADEALKEAETARTQMDEAIDAIDQWVIAREQH